MRKCLRCGAEMKENCDLRVQGAAEMTAFYDDYDDYIDDVIEPRNTRFRIIRALQSLATKRLQNPAKKHSNIPL